MPRFLTPSRRVASATQDTRPRLPSAPGPKPPARNASRSAAGGAIISREDTLAELRAIYRLLDTEQVHTAKQRLITLGRNLQA